MSLSAIKDREALRSLEVKGLVSGYLWVHKRYYWGIKSPKCRMVASYLYPPLKSSEGTVLKITLDLVDDFEQKSVENTHLLNSLSVFLST